MAKIYIKNASFAYKTFYNPVFLNITITIDTKWRLGIIGRNGRGKTTLLKLIQGQLNPDKGEIFSEISTEYFPYQYNGKYNLTMDVIKECIGGLRTLEEELDNPEILEQYLERDGFIMEGRIKREIKRIGLPEKVLERNFETLSGGEKTKILLVALFLKKDTFILLDEPTSHLDISGKEEVANYLSKKRGFILVSHDRDFLDKTIDHVLAINKSDVTIEKGNYSSWKKNYDIKEEFEIRTEKNLSREINKLENHAVKKRNWALVSNTQKYQFVTNSRTNGTQAYMAQAKRAEKKIERDILQKKNLLLNFEMKRKLEFSQEEIEEGYLLKVMNLDFAYGDTQVLKEVTFDLKRYEVLWVKGKNGCGKSTLLTLLFNKTKLPGIWYHKDVHFSMLMQEPVFPYDLSGNEFLKEGKTKEEYKKCKELCQIFDIPSEILRIPCREYSAGEKKKVYLAKILSQKNNVLILDEPLNYMDLMFREQLEKAIKESSPTMIFVEHDDIFGANIATSVLEL